MVKKEDFKVEVEDTEMSLVYTNGVKIDANDYDIQLTFSHQTVASNENKIKIKPVSKIVMSYQHAKVMVSLLQNHLNEFDKQANNPLSDNINIKKEM